MGTLSALKVCSECRWWRRCCRSSSASVLGNLDEKFAEMLKPASAITVPFFAFALGAGIDLRSLAVGGVTGIWLGLAVSVITGALTYLGYRWLLGERSAVGFAAGTTAGNSVATPAIVAQADAAFAPYVAVAAALKLPTRCW